MNPLALFAIGDIALYVMSQKDNKPTITKSLSGIIYNCDSIKIIDKDKFIVYVDKYTDIYFKKLKNIKSFNLIDLTGEFLKGLNNNCYLKFTQGALSRNAKIIILAFVEKLISSFAKLYFNKSEFDVEFQKTQEFIDWMHISNMARTDLINYIKANANDYSALELDQIEHLFDYNNNSFPKQ